MARWWFATGLRSGLRDRSSRGLDSWWENNRGLHVAKVFPFVVSLSWSLALEGPPAVVSVAVCGIM